MAVLRYKDGYYFFICSYAERQIAIDARFRWHQSKNMWHTTKPEYAKNLIDYADSAAKNAIKLSENAFEDSFSSGSDFEIPKPDGLEYRPFQKAGIEWCVARDVSLIADEPGLGKTIQAIGVANHFRLSTNRVPSILVVCPASVKIYWQRKFAEWAIFKHTTYIVEGREDIIPTWDNIIIINYDLLAGQTKKKDKIKGQKDKNILSELSKEIGTMDFDIGIIDEGHMLANPKSKRTIAVLGKKMGFIHKCVKQIFLTGTPVLSKPIELFPILMSVSPETIAPYDSYWKFARRFCGAYQGKWGWVVTGSSNEADLNRRLRSTIMIRRLKKEVLKELPDKQYQVIPFDLDKNTKKILIQEEIIDKEDLVKQKFTGFEVGDLAKLRHEMAKAKLPACIKFIKETMEGGTHKLVIFAHHKVIIAGLEKALSKYNPVKLTGDTPKAARQAAIDDFQSDDSIRIFLGNIQAAGIGITLTAASHVIFVESSWVPGEIEQAVDRCHRIGQTKSVLAQFLVVRDSIDEHMLNRIVTKEKVIDKIVN